MHLLILEPMNFFHNRHKSISKHCLRGLGFTQMTTNRFHVKSIQILEFNIDSHNNSVRKIFEFNFDLTLKENSTIVQLTERMLWLRFKWIFHNENFYYV